MLLDQGNTAHFELGPCDISNILFWQKGSNIFERNYRQFFAKSDSTSVIETKVLSNSGSKNYKCAVRNLGIYSHYALFYWKKRITWCLCRLITVRDMKKNVNYGHISFLMNFSNIKTVGRITQFLGRIGPNSDIP